MARPDNTRANDPYDDPDINIGDFVYARPMNRALIGVDTPELLLYFEETNLKTGPAWVQGWYKDADGDLPGMWWTVFGNLGVPTAWAPLPKSKDE